MGDDLTRTLIEQNSKILGEISDIKVSIARIMAKSEEIDKLKHEERISQLEKLTNQWLGNKSLFLWIVTNAISLFAVFAALRR